MLSFISKGTLEDSFKKTNKVLGKNWTYLKIFNSILEKYENFEEIKINKLKIEEISDTFYAIMKTLKSFQENKFQLYPEIFFSLNEFKNIKIVKLISDNKLNDIGEYNTKRVKKSFLIIIYYREYLRFLRFFYSNV